MTGSFPSGNEISQRSIVRAQARALDPDRYVAALLAPTVVRDDLIALAAFLGDVARIPRIVGEPMMGEIRFQWWRDAIGRAGGDERSGNPVADALSATIARHALPQPALIQLIDARAFELYPEAPADEKVLADRLIATEGAGFALAGRIVAGRDAADAEALFKAAGMAFGLTRILLGLPHSLARGRIPVPLSRFPDYSTGQPNVEHLGAVLPRLIDEARANLAEVRRGLRDAPAGLVTALLPLALVEPYLRALERAGHNALRTVVDIAPLTRVSRLGLAHWRGRV